MKTPLRRCFRGKVGECVDANVLAPRQAIIRPTKCIDGNFAEHFAARRDAVIAPFMRHRAGDAIGIAHDDVRAIGAGETRDRSKRVDDGLIELRLALLSLRADFAETRR